jgi:PKD repeat protein
VDPQPSFPLNVGATWGTDDKIVCLWDLKDGYDVTGGQLGLLWDVTVVAYADGVCAGQRLQLYWFPSLTLASGTVGFTYYGKYTDANSPPLDGSAEWKTPPAGSSASLVFITASEGGSNPDAAGWATLVTGLLAGFSASPISGVTPLTVTFTDISFGPITNRHWQFGDGATLDTTETNVVHTYTTAGSHTVTLLVSGPPGNSTKRQFRYITVVTPLFPAWQAKYFGCTNCPQAAATADPDGDGQNNLAEFLAGSDPTNSASAFRILSLTRNGNNVDIVWATVGGQTNAVQTAAGDADGCYTTDFVDISDLIVIPGSGDTTTNHVDAGGATNAPSRYYRVRLVP